jgi:hypothetical protein
MKNKRGAARLIELEVLRWIDYHTRDTDYFVYLRAIARNSDIDVEYVRVAARRLWKVDGLIEFRNGLIDEDGFLAGSGYRITRKGIRYMDLIERRKKWKLVHD